MMQCIFDCNSTLLKRWLLVEGGILFSFFASFSFPDHSSLVELVWEKLDLPDVTH